MANTKEYKIVINGITESVKAVESLNKELNELEARIKALEGKSVGVKTSGGGGGSSSSKSSLSEEEKLAKQIEQIDAKRVAYSQEIYQNYLAAKDVLKETVTDQKSIAASERLQANSYSNTIQGMKQELADIKSALQTVDLGDTDKMDAMVKRANELNEALKKIEESYGQFGRNVGNYSSAFDGLDKVKVTIGGTVREFSNAREASRTLNNELKTMAINGQQDTEAFKQLRQVVMQLESAINDAKKPMDNLMDAMQGVMAVASMGQGISALFGIDNSEIQKSIQKLVALQNVLQGIETINKQMQTGEGIGKYLSKGNESIDKMVASLTGAKIAEDGLTMSSKAATVAVRGLSLAMKALSAVGIVAVITAISWAIEKVVEVTSDWVRGNDKLVSSEQQLKVKLEAVNEELERNLRLNQAKANAKITNSVEKQAADEEAYAEAIRKVNEEIEKRMKLNPNNSTFADYASGKKGNQDIFKDKGVTTLGGFTEEIKDADELVKRYNALSDAVNKITGLVYKNAKGFEIARLTASDVRDEFNHLEQMLAGRLYNAMKQFDTTTEEGRKGLQNFVIQIQNSDDVMYKSALLRLPELVDNEKGALGDGLNEWLRLIRQFVAGANAEMNNVNFQNFANSLIESADETGKKLAERQKKELRDRYNSLSKEEQQAQKKKFDEAMAAIDKNLKKRTQKVNAGYKKLEKDTREAENDLANLKIANMKEGLNKVITQLEEERKQRIAKIKADGKLVAERTAEANIYYDNKILDERKKWANDVEKIYQDMWDKVLDFSVETQNKILQNEEKFRENLESFNDKQISKRYRQFTTDPLYNFDLSSYGVQGSNQLSKETRKTLGIEEEASRKLQEIFKLRLGIIEDYWEVRQETEENSLVRIYNEEVRLENENYDKLLRENAEYFKDLSRQADEQHEAHKLSDERYAKIINTQKKQALEREKVLEKEHLENLSGIQRKFNSERQKLNADYYRQTLQELRDFQTAVSNLESKQPVLNVFGTTNFNKTNANNRILLKSYEQMAKEIVKLKKKLQEQLDKNEITFDDFQNANRELDRFVDNLGQKMDEVKYKLSVGGRIQQFIQDIEVYLQEVMKDFNTIMQAVWSAEDAEFDKEQEKLDKWNEELDNKLDEQQDIVQQHKDAIDEIEDELATARGDRRQHLIDQINAEMAAERAAQKEKQKIEKEQQKAQKKQDELEKERKKAQYERDKLQAIVNGAMAVTYAAMNAWPVPAIPMMALAAATTAAQVAIMASNKPYAKGGVLEGPSHKQGGIPVGNTGIEVEGKEYVIRKKSTTPNVELLDMINRSERKLNLDDFIDFYTSGKIKKNISSMSPRTRFAEGGTIPTITNDYAFDDRLLTAFEDYSNRPVYVSVVDINNRQDAVKNVQVLAGIE